MQSSDRRLNKIFGKVALCQRQKCIHKLKLSLPSQIVENLCISKNTFLFATCLTRAFSFISTTEGWRSSISCCRRVTSVSTFCERYVWYLTINFLFPSFKHTNTKNKHISVMNITNQLSRLQVFFSRTAGSEIFLESTSSEQRFHTIAILHSHASFLLGLFR